MSQLLAHFDLISHLLELENCIDIVNLHFAKVSDKVDIGITLKKLKSLGIHGHLSKWLQSFLSGHLQSVLVEEKKSQPKPVLSGAPQGSVLGPLLFLLLIGDIDQDVTTPFLYSFADDTHIGHGITCEDMRKLQADLNSRYSWAVNSNNEFR